MASELADCFCTLAELLGNAKSQATAAMDALIALLTTMKAYLALVNWDLEDNLRKIAGELALAVLQEAEDTVAEPFAVVIAATSILADCPPVNTLTKILKDVRDLVLGEFDSLEYEISQFANALEAKRLQLEQIDRWITTLTQARDKLDECGSS